MRGLHGDFSTMPLPDVVVYLGNRRTSGALHLERASFVKKIHLKDGLVVNASSNDPREYLGQFLINMGHLSEEQFNKAYETQRETQIFLGKILVMIGLVSEEIVRNTLSLKMRETLLEAFGWTEGTFHFDPDAPPEPLEGLDVSIDLLDIHREGEFRMTAWEAIRGAFPSGSAQLQLIEANLPEAPRPGSLDERLFTLIRRGHTIDEIVLALHATDFFLYQRLYALYRLEAVKVAEGMELPPQGEDLVDADEPLLGEPILGQELVAHGQEALLEQMRQRLGGAGAIPKLRTTPAKLRELQLSAPERYLLSRVDGERSVTSIIQVSPLRELEALRFFVSFVESGLIDVE